jgi:hypothetical protein
MARKKSRDSQTARQQPIMTPQEGRDYLARWERIAEQKRDAISRLTPAEKLDILNRLKQRAALFRPRSADLTSEIQIWMRWNRLREACRD